MEIRTGQHIQTQRTTSGATTPTETTSEETSTSIPRAPRDATQDHPPLSTSLQQPYQSHTSTPQSIAFNLTPAEKAQTLETFLRHHFSQMDNNDDGWLSTSDLSRAQSNPNFSPQEKVMLARLQSHISDIEELSNDEWGDENDGITLEDLSALTQEARNNSQSELIQGLFSPPQSTNPNAQSLYNFVESHFGELDRDQDGWLSEEDLSQALANPSYSQEQKVMLTRLRANLSDIEELSNDEWGDENDGATLKDMQAFVRSSNQAQVNTSVQSLTGLVSSASRQSADAYQLFANHFPQLDQDHDGWVTRQDLQRASQDPQFNPQEQAWFSRLSEQVGEIEELSNDEWGDENDGITLKDMQAFVRTHRDPLIEFTYPDDQEIVGDFNIQIQDINGIGDVGKGDIQGNLTGTIALGRGVMDTTLNNIRQKDLSLVSIESASFNPYEQAYDIDFSSILDDFQVSLRADDQGRLFLELSDNWLSDERILSSIRDKISSELGDLNLNMEREGNRLYFTPVVQNLTLPIQGNEVTVDEVNLTPDNSRFEIDSQGNILLHLDNVDFAGSTGEGEVAPDRAPDSANLDIAFNVDLNDDMTLNTATFDVEGDTQIDIENQAELEALASHLDIDMESVMTAGFIALIFGESGTVSLDDIKTQFTYDPNAEETPLPELEEGNLTIDGDDRPEMSYDIEAILSLIRRLKGE